MGRKRFVSTDISLDPRVNKLAIEYGDFAALLYTWMIPHANDDATITGDPEQLLYLVVPGRRDKTVEDVVRALEGMHELGLICWDRESSKVTFPQSFYRYQSYIPPARRGKPADSPATAKQNFSATSQKNCDTTAEQNISAFSTQNNAYLSLSLSLNKDKKDQVSNDTLSGETPDDAHKVRTSDSKVVKEVMDYYNELFGDLWARPLKLTDERRRKIQARLRTYSVEELKTAIRNIRASPFHCGENDKGQVYATPEFIFRNDSQVDKWLNMPPKEAGYRERADPAKGTDVPDWEKRFYGET